MQTFPAGIQQLIPRVFFGLPARCGEKLAAALHVRRGANPVGGVEQTRGVLEIMAVEIRAGARQERRCETLPGRLHGIAGGVDPQGLADVEPGAIVLRIDQVAFLDAGLGETQELRATSRVGAGLRSSIVRRARTGRRAFEPIAGLREPRRQQRDPAAIDAGLAGRVDRRGRFVQALLQQGVLRLGPQPFLNLREAGPCRVIRGIARQCLLIQIERVVVARRGEAIRRERRLGACHQRRFGDRIVRSRRARG